MWPEMCYSPGRAAADEGAAVSTGMSEGTDGRTGSRGRVADRLSDLLDEITLNLEHGVPVSLLDALREVGAEIRGSEVAARSAQIAGELHAFDEGVTGMRRGDPDAPDKVLCRGRRLVGLLTG